MESSIEFPVKIVGEIVKGFGRGSKELGIPTANVDSESIKTITLPNGIYFGWSQLVISSTVLATFQQDQRDRLMTILKPKDGDTFVSPILMMSASLGYNPYYQNKEKSLEVHILHEFKCDLYGASLVSTICGRVRDEANFESLEALVETIHQDIQVTKRELSKPEWLKVKQDETFFQVL